MVVRPVEIIRGQKDIGDLFGVGRGTVLEWVKAGAPIVRVNTIYCTDKTEIWEWVKLHEGEKVGSKENLEAGEN